MIFMMGMMNTSIVFIIPIINIQGVLMKKIYKCSRVRCRGSDETKVAAATVLKQSTREHVQNWR